MSLTTITRNARRLWSISGRNGFLQKWYKNQRKWSGGYELASSTNKIDSVFVFNGLERFFYPSSYPLPENKISVSKPEIKCLAATMYYEAGNQGEVGQYLVAHVVVNRMRAYEKDAVKW